MESWTRATASASTEDAVRRVGGEVESARGCATDQHSGHAAPQTGGPPRPAGAVAPREGARGRSRVPALDAVPHGREAGQAQRAHEAADHRPGRGTGGAVWRRREGGAAGGDEVVAGGRGRLTGGGTVSAMSSLAMVLASPASRGWGPSRPCRRSRWCSRRNSRPSGFRTSAVAPPPPPTTALRTARTPAPRSPVRSTRSSGGGAGGSAPPPRPPRPPAARTARPPPLGDGSRCWRGGRRRVAAGALGIEGGPPEGELPTELRVRRVRPDVVPHDVLRDAAPHGGGEGGVHVGGVRRRRRQYYSEAGSGAWRRGDGAARSVSAAPLGRDGRGGPEGKPRRRWRRRRGIGLPRQGPVGQGHAGSRVQVLLPLRAALSFPPPHLDSYW